MSTTNTNKLQVTPIILAYFTPLIILSPFSAPLFWETNVESAVPSAKNGIIDSPNNFLAALCPAIVKYPKLFIEDSLRGEVMTKYMLDVAKGIELADIVLKNGYLI